MMKKLFLVLLSVTWIAASAVSDVATLDSVRIAAAQQRASLHNNAASSKVIAYFYFAMDKQGNFYFPNLETRKIIKFSPTGVQQWSKDTYAFSYPFGIAIDSSNNIFVTAQSVNWDRSLLLKYDTNGKLRSNTSFAQSSSCAVYNQLRANNSNDLVASVMHSCNKPVRPHSIQRVSKEGYLNNYIINCVSANSCDFGDFAVDSKDNVIFNDFMHKEIRRYTKYGSWDAKLVTWGDTLNSNVIALDSDDNLLLSNFRNLFKVDIETGDVHKFTNHSFNGYVPIYGVIRGDYVYVLSIKDWGSSYLYSLDKFALDGRLLANVMILF